MEKSFIKNLKKLKKSWKNGPHLSCDLHKIGVNLYSKLQVALFPCKKVGHWVGGWRDGRQSRVKDCLQQSKMHPLLQAWTI